MEYLFPFQMLHAHVRLHKQVLHNQTELNYISRELKRIYLKKCYFYTAVLVLFNSCTRIIKTI